MLRPRGVGCAPWERPHPWACTGLSGPWDSSRWHPVRPLAPSQAAVQMSPVFRVAPMTPGPGSQPLGNLSPTPAKGQAVAALICGSNNKNDNSKCILSPHPPQMFRGFCH